jgi:hypothetical protein
VDVAAARAIFRDLPRACEDGRDIDARQSLAVASCLAGLAFTKASVGYVHVIAHQLGPLYHLPHGHLNAILLPYVLDFYVDGAASRMADLARACGLGRDGEDPRSLALSLVAAFHRLQRRRTRRHGFGGGEPLSVTLELGGKAPAVVAPDFPLATLEAPAGLSPGAHLVDPGGAQPPYGKLAKFALDWMFRLRG